jgi:hypothetical protein
MISVHLVLTPACAGVTGVAVDVLLIKGSRFNQKPFARAPTSG